MQRSARSPATAAPPPLMPPLGAGTEWCGGPLAELEAAAAWTPLWLRPDAPAVVEAAWLEPLRALPAFPELPPLTGEDFRAGFAAAPLRKAAGLDDWVAEELRLWPAPLCEALALLLTAGAWAAQAQDLHILSERDSADFNAAIAALKATGLSRLAA